MSKPIRRGLNSAPALSTRGSRAPPIGCPARNYRQSLKPAPPAKPYSGTTRSPQSSSRHCPKPPCAHGEPKINKPLFDIRAPEMVLRDGAQLKQQQAIELDAQKANLPAVL